MLKKILVGLLVVLIVIQFIKPERNLSDDNTTSVATKYDMPKDVDLILQKACYDCHSNKTVYPWYSNIQPVAWWLAGHVNDGKRHLNYSAFTTSPLARQFHKFEETVEVLEENEMPLESYTWLGMHSNAKLTDEEKAAVISWAKAQMDTMRRQYPPDSLVRKRRS
ncbi:heme-binding domain-containing protein [Chryseolinea sp. T2]|uniref:heme-binding domain-containing protein n=1 Tax=Chryseolinea sp. T2 TaxID=3129255 RepID=UPI003077062B